MDTLIYAQGQTATFYGFFTTTPAGSPINVSDATIKIFGPAATVILPATPMLAAGPTGLYYYDWLIPNSLPVNTYTVVISGTVMAVPTATTQLVQVVLAGSATSFSISQKVAELTAALEIYLDCPQHIAVKAEVAMRQPDYKTYKLNWPNWNLSNPMVYLNEEPIAQGDPMFPYTIDYDNGIVTFANALAKTDKVDVTYNFRMFNQVALIQFISDAISEINVQAPPSSLTLDNFPDELVGILMMGAVRNALKRMMTCMQFQETATIFGGRQGAKDAYQAFKDIKENNEKSFNDAKIQIKKRLPKIFIISTPEYTLPGGRSRWFRYLFSSGLG